ELVTATTQSPAPPYSTENKPQTTPDVVQQAYINCGSLRWDCSLNGTPIEIVTV
ncbi:hypothetical protein QUC31_007003, partial [Theobroma cacao]